LANVGHDWSNADEGFMPRETDRAAKLAHTPKLTYSRKTTAHLLDRSEKTVKRRFEDLGRLTPLRLTGPNGPVSYAAEQVNALIAEARAQAAAEAAERALAAKDVLDQDQDAPDHPPPEVKPKREVIHRAP
jgi:hypothetical protein